MFLCFEDEKAKLIRLRAEYSELARILSTLTGTNSYYIDKMVELKGKIAILESNIT